MPYLKGTNNTIQVKRLGGCAYMGAGNTWEICVSSGQFFCESKTALKKKSSLLKKKKKEKFKLISLPLSMKCFQKLLSAS